MNTAIDLHLNAFTHTPVGRLQPTLDSITLTIAAGEFVVLTGASGSGKSTLLKALAGLLPEDSHPDEDATGTSGCVLMVQNPTHAFVAPTSGLDIAFGPENRCVAPHDIPVEVWRARSEAAFAAELTRDPFQLSGGQQQRLALAGVLACDAGAILLDEPLSMLDETTARGVRESLLAIAPGRTLVIADHHLDHWREHADRILEVLPGGRIRTWSPSPAARHETIPNNEPDGSAKPIVLDVAPAHTFHGQRLLADATGLTVRAGEMCAVTGISGVGKSTFLRHVIEASRDTSTRAARYRAAWLAQNPESTFVARTVRAEVCAGSGLPEDDPLISEVLTAVGLEDLDHANPFALSGGQQRRLAFASALASQRPVLVLDEPTVGLDHESFARIWDLITEARARGIAVIAATHDPRISARATSVVHLEPYPARTDLSLASSAKELSIEPIPPTPRRPRAVASDALNPLTLILCAASAFIGSWAVTSITTGLIVGVFSLALIPLTFRTWGRLAMRLIPITLASAMIAWSILLLTPGPWNDENTWQVATVEALRVFSMVAPGALLLESVEASRLGPALARYTPLSARAAVATVAGLSRLAHLFGQWRSLLFARKVRGIHQRHPIALYRGATFALLVDSLRGAEVQALAMDARGFAHADARTWTHPSRLSIHDVWGAALALTLLGGPMLVNMVV